MVSPAQIVQALLEGEPDDAFDAEELVRSAELRRPAFTKQEVVDFFNTKLAPWQFRLAHDNRDLGHDDLDAYVQLDAVAPPETPESVMRARLRRGAERFAAANGLFVVEVFVNLGEPGSGMVSFRVADKLHLPGFRDWWSIAKKRRLWKEQEMQRRYGPRTESEEDDFFDPASLETETDFGSLIPFLEETLPGKYEVDYAYFDRDPNRPGPPKGRMGVLARKQKIGQGGVRLRAAMTPQDVGLLSKAIRDYMSKRGYESRVWGPDELRTSEIVPVSFSVYYWEPPLDKT